MSEVPTVSELSRSVPVPQLLFELPSRSKVFWGNLRDLMIPRRRPPLELSSAPAPFWPDVFVKRDVPWLSLLESCAYHAIVFALLISLNRFLIHRPTVVLSRTFDHSQVMRNKQEGNIALLLQIMKEIDYLGLHGNVQCAYRFVADE